jgi:hypothetical protein
VETEDGRRSLSGVLLSLVENTPGEFRLVLDDVSNQGGSGLGPWRHESLFTLKSYSRADIENQTLSERQLAEIGFNVLARLRALHGHPVK